MSHESCGGLGRVCVRSGCAAGEGAAGLRLPVPWGPGRHFPKGGCGAGSSRVPLELGRGLCWKVQSCGAGQAGDTHNPGRRGSWGGREK